MTLRLSGRLVIPAAFPVKVCRHNIRAKYTERYRINPLTCCVEKRHLCIPEASDKTFELYAPGNDFTGVTEIDILIQTNGIGGATLINKTLSGGGVVVAADDLIVFSLDDTESTTTGRHYWRGRVTNSAGLKTVFGAGRFDIERVE